MSKLSGRVGTLNFAPDAAPSKVVDFLAQCIPQDGNFCIAVPGGSTPVPILGELAHRDLNLAQTTVYLTDDRIVAENHPASNLGLVRRALANTAAQVEPLVEGAVPPRFDLVWLGMGADGHIASLFPNTDPQPDAPGEIVRITPDPLPPEAPFDRLTLTIPALLNCRQLMLVLKGAEKRHILDGAIAGDHDLPIARLLRTANMPVTIFWSET